MVSCAAVADRRARRLPIGAQTARLPHRVRPARLSATDPGDMKLVANAHRSEMSDIDPLASGLLPIIVVQRAQVGGYTGK